MNFKFVITNLAGGGAEKVMLILAKGLVNRGNKVEVILLENIIQHKVPDNVKVTKLSEKLNHGWFGKRLIALKLRNYLHHKTNKYDIVVSALPFANEIAYIANLKRHWYRIDNTLGSEIKNLNISNPAKAERRLKRYQKIYNNQSLIAISDGMVEDLVNIGIIANIVKIYNPFDLDSIKKAIKDMPSDLLLQQPYLIHIGRFNKQKRHDILLDAWKIANMDKMLILLTPNNIELQEMINERGLSNAVKIVGFKKNPYPWIANAIMMVMSSDHEGLPGVMIESLICGTPVVSTDCPSGPKEILADVPECLVTMGSPEKLAAKIISCTKKLPDIGKIDLSCYSMDIIAKKYEELAITTIKSLDN
ncbi:glycosyltransferase [Candidatus Woesearchaeota archaeon]|jgi:glycosyltransferase involved in cell wall biosynthesis|nr:glycosyltransferase [bacterium]MBT7558423.1 glycosyltransferase [Candidatus Woesearchaeota archaeon]